MSPGTATRYANECRLFFEDDGSTLWLTFHGERLWWSFLTEDPAQPDEDGDTVRRPVRGGWCSVDAAGKKLSMDRLSGALTQLAAYRGTSCSVSAAGYAIDRINGKTRPEVDRAVAAKREAVDAARGLMVHLGDTDFEVLVDLIFASSGWRRITSVGRTKQMLDLDLVLPSTGERAFVQVKSKTNSGELADYVKQFKTADHYQKMFFAYHTGSAETPDANVTVLGPDKLAELAVDAGLLEWLILKVR
jgi:hypothetical protein